MSEYNNNNNNNSSGYSSYNNGYSYQGGEYRGGHYNDDLYMDDRDSGYTGYKSTGSSPRYTPPVQPEKRKAGFGKKLLSVLLVGGLMLGSSAATLAGYIYMTGGKQQPTQVIEGGQQIVYTLSSEEGSLTPQEIFVKCSPSVVAISTQTRSYYGIGGGSGTGIIMSEDGYIITNHHVIDGATSITVTTKNGEYPAVIVGSEAKSDIAVLKIEAQGLQVAEFGSSAELVTGDSAIVIGNPLGLEFADTMTIGYVSATEREVQISEYIMSLIQIDAAVNPGNSGGPLINSRGQVVGVVNAKISQDDVEGIGFAIPMDTAMNIAEDLIEHGYVTNRPMLGITVQSISEEQAAYYGYEPGITVTEVSPGSCAEQGGMKAGDKILAFNGVEVSNATELNYEKDKCSVGDTVTVTIERDGQQMDLTIVLSAGTAA